MTGQRVTIQLSERKTRRVQLTPDDAGHLAARHRPHVEVLPAGDGVYRLTARGYVGTILGPGVRLVLLPKIPVANVLCMADGTDFVGWDIDPESGGGRDLADLTGVRLAGRMIALAQQGLYRSYKELTTTGPYLQGRLDVRGQVRGGPARKDAIASEHENWTADLPCNQVAKGAALLLLRQVGAEARAGLHEALGYFGEVSAVPLSPELCRAAEAGVVGESYAPLLGLCRLVADGLHGLGGRGDGAGQVLLVNLERVFERYCSRHLVPGLTSACAVTVREQQSLVPHTPAAGARRLRMCPDLTLMQGDRVVGVIDMKWKARTHLRRDLYQVLGYCAALGCRLGVVIYPGGTNRVWEYRFDGGVTLVVCRLQVTGAPADCQSALARQVAAIGRYVTAQLA